MKTTEAIDKLKKAIASPATPENFKETMRKKLAELEGVKETVTKVEKVVKKAAKKKKAKGKKQKEPTKYVKGATIVTAKRDGDVEEPGCDELLKRFNDRREAAKKAQRKAKTTPVFTKISSDVVDAVEKAINNVDASDIKDAPKATINKFEALKTAAENFLKAFKSVLGEDYKAKDSEKEIKELEDLISKLGSKYLNK